MEFAVTVIGHDRVGIVADVAEALARLGANLTDSTMTRLRGHFTMTLICTVDASVGDLEAALRPLTDVTVTVREVGPDEPISDAGEPYVLSVHGADRLGIVAAVTRAVADARGNITDLSTRLTGTLYLLIAEIDLSSGTAQALAQRLADLEKSLGVEISLRQAETDVL
ncbi:glycine cleavage system protein R [Allorhizocola rhizosphaerae]|uniref:glycine cleavage system protein R n=1 Tax=Allorhizocola rhizosphaerae TaxID=1872709 RepID=UPI000E3E23A4|nr:ACT domain-containing protein [Allorhizocola rhizosphaerae]